MIENILQYATPGIKTALQNASAKTGIGFDYLLSKAFKESSLKEDAKASTSSATGLFQFVNATWTNMVKAYGSECGLGKYQAALQSGQCNSEMKQEMLDLRKNPELSSFMAARLTQENQQVLKNTIGRAPDEKELYLAHFMGPGLAGKFIKQMDENSDASPCVAFKNCAASNPAIFKDGKSYGDIYAQLTKDVAVTQKAQPTQSVVPPVTPPATHRTFDPGSLMPKSLGQQNLSSWMVLDLLNIQDEFFSW